MVPVFERVSCCVSITVFAQKAIFKFSQSTVAVNFKKKRYNSPKIIVCLLPKMLIIFFIAFFTFIFFTLT